MPRDVRGETRREPREFREEDREKLVVAPGGVMLGRIGYIDPEGRRATVERTDDHDSLTEEITEWLGWGDDNDADESTREIGPEHVDRYEEDRIYLRDRS
jgi:hypothetical protein